uniref:argininosuccinate synthase, chloroplastic-like n=1 Tax=Fragaria vesca subsp. vesca TaxID=101020 RepID=UPI0005CAFCCC|nr:PREDICTED: argininosuccinate synthase, chloroplastic-like [Fragaria vesca subsp. vesca]
MDAQGKNIGEIRFEPTFFALDPKLNVVAPWREWDSVGSEDAIGHAKKHNVPVPVSNKSINSRDENLWCRCREVVFNTSFSFVNAQILGGGILEPKNLCYV